MTQDTDPTDRFEGGLRAYVDNMQELYGVTNAQAALMLKSLAEKKEVLDSHSMEDS